MKYIAVLDSENEFTEEVINDLKNTGFLGDNPRYAFAIEDIQEHKVGKWIMPNKYYDKNIWRKCSVCNTHFEKYHKYIAFTGEVTYTEEIANYCKVCGAEMVGAENE